MLRTYKYRIYPTCEQEVLINKTIGVCRLVYNLALQVKIVAYKSAGINLSGYDIQKQLVELKKEYPWIADVNSQALCASIANMDSAFSKFYKGAGYPKFKSKKSAGSFHCRNNTRRIDWANSLLTIPKIKDIPIILSRKFDGDIRTVTISRTTTGRYFASILVNTYQNEIIPPKRQNAIGVDLGLSHFAITSTGIKVDNPRFLKNSIERLKVLQRRASQKRKGSKRHKRALLKSAVLHERIVNQRNDFLHKLSTELIRDNQTDTICVESLAVSNMMRNRNLSQAIADVSWSEFIRQLEYKAKWYGKNLVKIDRFFASSKTCSICGHKVESLPLSVREWACQCGAIHDRDINAAINIRNSGMACPGELAEQSAMKGCDDARRIKCKGVNEKNRIFNPDTSKG